MFYVLGNWITMMKYGKVIRSVWAKYCESLTSLPVYNQTPFSSLVLQYVDAPFFLFCCPLVVFKSLKKFKYHPLTYWLFQTQLFCYLYCPFFYCPCYRTQPSLLLAPLFHPFQLANLWSLPTYCSTPPTALLSHESPERACKGKLSFGIVPLLFGQLFWHLCLICVENHPSQNSFK